MGVGRVLMGVGRVLMGVGRVLKGQNISYEPPHLPNIYVAGAGGGWEASA